MRASQPAAVNAPIGRAALSTPGARRPRLTLADPPAQIGLARWQASQMARHAETVSAVACRCTTSRLHIVRTETAFAADH
jgi:hypothetical protein